MFQKGCMDDKGCSSNVALNSAVSNSNIAHLSWLVNSIYYIYNVMKEQGVCCRRGPSWTCTCPRTGSQRFTRWEHRPVVLNMIGSVRYYIITWMLLNNGRNVRGLELWNQLKLMQTVLVFNTIIVLFSLFLLSFYVHFLLSLLVRVIFRPCIQC